MESKDEYIKILESQVRVQKAIVAKLKKKYNHVDNIIEDPTGQICDIVSNETPIQSPDADNTERGEIEKQIFLNFISEIVDSVGEVEKARKIHSGCATFKVVSGKSYKMAIKPCDMVVMDEPTPPTLLNELRENADTDSAILDALSTILQVGASMATNGISDEISEWDLPKTTSIKAKRKIVKEAEKWNDVNRKRAIELKNAYDVLSRSYHNRPL